MHEKHVTIKNARCFECHQPILHKKSDFTQPEVAKTQAKKTMAQKPMGEQFIADSCQACHPKPHQLQRLLAAGHKQKDVPESPDFHFKASATCLACHLERQFTKKGQPVLKASAKTCVGCHKGRENLLKDWKTELEEEVKYTKEVEKEALDALAKAKAKLPKPKLAEANQILAQGQQNLKMVQFGNGVHNKKYSLFLLDAAITRFEDTIDYIDENKQ
jgi:formate-dependent nitrite reductase cytochrome c552 subunit